MNSKMLGKKALSVIDSYMHFQFGSAVAGVPYFNNKTSRTRAALRTFIGKGSPNDIHEEIQSEVTRSRIDPSAFSDEALKKLLVDKNLGIDCSAFAFYALDAEAEDQGRGSLEKKIRFIHCTGLLGKMRCALRPVENCDVSTLADEANSFQIQASDVRPGDMITMVSKEGADEPDRDHILVIHQVDFKDSAPSKVHYSHAIAYPEDGVLGTGVKQGTITLGQTSLFDGALWEENGKTGDSNRLFVRAGKSKTEIRRLKALA